MSTFLRQVPTSRLIALLLVVAVGAAGWVGLAQQSGQVGDVVVAEFSSASPLLSGSDVKVDGVKVGVISDIRLGEGNRAQVSMKLDSTARPLHTDATARIRAVSLLGERYLDLHRGSDAAPVLPVGGRLPASQTAQNTGLDQVLNTIDQPTGQSLAELVGTLGEGLDGNGASADAVVRALGPAMRDTGSLSKLLDEQNGLLNSLVDKLQPVAGGLADDHGRTLDGLVGSANTLSRTAAERQQELGRTLGELPQTLADARRVLGGLTGTAQQTTPTLRDLRPVTDDLTAISGEIDRLSQSADPALASAEPVLDRARELLDQARPVTDELRRASPDLRSGIGSARPLVTELANNFGNVLNFVRYWALTTNGYDGISHYFRAHITFDAGVAANHVGGQLGTGAPGVPPLSHPPPGAAGGAQPQQPGQPPPPQPTLLAPPNAPGGSATGLNERQEGNALQFLLGGGRK